MGDRDKQEKEAYPLALGHLAMEAARLEQETKNLVWMVCGAPYMIGVQMTKGKQLGAICDDGKELAKLLPPEVAESMVSILAKVKRVWNRRNDLLHSSWLLGSPGGDYYEDLVKVTFGKRGVSVTPTSAATIEQAADEIRAVTKEVRTLAFDKVLPNADPYPPSPEMEKLQTEDP
jgi:hypothetical protein